MDSIRRTVSFIIDNWSAIATVICIIIAVSLRIKSFMRLSKEDREKAAWDAVKKIMLALVSSAEKEWGSKTGAIKRAEIIQQIYKAFPVIKEQADQQAVERRLDELIDKSLCEMRDILDSANPPPEKRDKTDPFEGAPF